MGNKRISTEINKHSDPKELKFHDGELMIDAEAKLIHTCPVENMDSKLNQTEVIDDMAKVERNISKILRTLNSLSLKDRINVSQKCPYFGQVLEVVPKFQDFKIVHPLTNDPFTLTFMPSDSRLKRGSWNGDFLKSTFASFSLFFMALIFISTVGSNPKNPFTKENFAKFWLGKVKGYDLSSERCVIESPQYFADLFRPPVNCGGCAGISEIPKVSHLSKAEFENKYAYSLQPVVITDAQTNWTAKDTFTLDFFKGIYHEGSPVLDKAQRSCQFFPYKTEFKSLAQVFNMKPERAQLKDGSKPWYVGWSNCDPEAANILRRYYSQPYFLPSDSESSRTDWIFMGSPGYGAHMHIDHVGKPSWQAQIKGAKKWILEPPPECYITCKNLEVTVLPGETIVLDTNRWYHKTMVVGNEMSVVIGSEYD